MRQDELFNVLYRRIMYGGSFYKGTKYGKPEEFDLDFIIKLPINYSKITVDNNKCSCSSINLWPLFNIETCRRLTRITIITALSRSESIQMDHCIPIGKSISNKDNSFLFYKFINLF